MQAQPLLQTAGSEPTGRARHDMRPNRRCSTDAVMPSWPPKAAATPCAIAIWREGCACYPRPLPAGAVPRLRHSRAAPYRRHGKPWQRPALQNLDDYDIVRIYGAEYRGIVNYYLLARDVYRLSSLRRDAVTSMLKTLAAKHRSSVTKMAARHRTKIETSDGKRTCYEARKERRGRKDLIARFGGIPLKRDKSTVITDPAPVPARPAPRELIHRLRRRWCELRDRPRPVSAHQVARLADLGKPGPGQPAWAALMAKMRRKTLIVCTACHDHIHTTPVTQTA